MVADYYRELAAQRLSVSEKAIADGDAFAKQVVSHNAIRDFEALAGTMPPDARQVFVLGIREFQYALEAVIGGNYRHAHISLRLAFELWVASIRFSADLLKLKLWMAGTEDLLWSTLNDPDKGLFSHTFLNAFFPELKEYRMQYLGLSNTVYRECSEYVHGNPHTHEPVDAARTYDRDKFLEFHDRVETVRLCVLFGYACRFLKDLDNGKLPTIEPLISEAFGELSEIQDFFGAAR